MEFENEDQTESEDSIAGINVAPLVDVCLVLVLIFMVTSPFFAKPLMAVKLPEAVSSTAENSENLTISISPDEGFALNEIPLNKAALGTELKKQIKKTGFTFVLIRADERVPHGEVEDVMKLAKRMGARRIAFATTPKVR